MALLSFSLFLFIVPSKVHAATLIHDSFTDSDGITLQQHNSTWSPRTGTAYIQNNMATHNVSGEYTLNYSGNNLADSCIQADLQFPFTQYAEFWLRYVDRDNHNYLYINHLDDTSKTGFGLGLFFQGNPQLVDQIALDTPPGTHNVKFCAIGNDTYLYFDNVLSLSPSIPGYPGTFPSGEQGINLFGSGIQVDNLEVNDGQSTTPVPNPVLSAISGATINAGDTYTTTGSFTDPNSTSWTATVDYGDGSGGQPLSLSGTSFTLSHAYTNSGTYAVTVHVTDYQGSTGTTAATVTVNNSNTAPTVGTITITPSPAHINSAITASASFTDADVQDTHTATWNWGDGNTTTGTVTETNGSGTVSNMHTYTSFGTYTVTLTVTDNHGATANNTATVTVVKQITALDPAVVWTSKNLLNIGLKLDLKADAYKNSTLVSSGEVDSVSVGTGGNPTSQTITFNSFSPVDFPSGSQLKITVYARNACSGSLLNSGTANLYFNSSAQDSRFGATIGTTHTTYHLLDGFLLGTSASNTQKSISVAAGAKCSAFRSFGTWIITP